MMASPSWSLAHTATREDIDQLSADLFRGPLAEQMSLLQDPRWLAALAGEPTKSVRAYVLRSGDAVVGYAGFLVHPSALRIAFGELTLLSMPVRHLRSFTAPVVAATDDTAGWQHTVAALLHRMRQDLAPDEVIFLESVIDDTALMDLFKQWEVKRHEFRILQNGKPYQHRSALIGDSFDGYLKQLGSRTRADLRSTRKKFIEHVNGNFRTRCFRAAHEVTDFVVDAVTISRKTYQYDLLGAGLRDREMLERLYRATADLGWFRSYILYANDEPLSFQVGHLYRGRYHAQEIGYVPEWARHHVGIFLHTEIVTDLAGAAEGAQWFDFGIGDTQHKQRLSTQSSAGSYYYLIPDTRRGSFAAASLHATNSVSAAVGATLERFGLRQKARQLLRKLGAAR